MNNTAETDIAIIKNDINYIKSEVRNLANNYVQQAEFRALKARVDLAHRVLLTLLLIVGTGLIGAFLKVILK